MASPGGTATISLSLSPLNSRSSSWTDPGTITCSRVEFVRIRLTLIDTVGDIVGLGVDEAHTFVPGEHGLAQLGRSFGAVALGPVAEGLDHGAFVAEPAPG